MAFWLARLAGFEPATGCLEGSCSVLLSYRRRVCNFARPRSRGCNGADEPWSHSRAGAARRRRGLPIVLCVTATVRRARPAEPRRSSQGWPVAVGILAGTAADALLGDPRRGHPVALFGRAAQAVQRRAYADSRARGAGYAAGCLLAAAVPAVAADRMTRGRPWLRVAATPAAVWTATGGRSLAREAERIAAALQAGDLEAARAALPNLCGRDPSRLGEGEIARAVVESVAENPSHPIVAPVVWCALAGLAGAAGCRAVNTLDAMVG